MDPDFGATADDYARHRAGFPASLFECLAALGIGEPGRSVLDLGIGTGSLARGFARRGCRVTGLDPAAPLLEKARGLDAAAEARRLLRPGGSVVIAHFDWLPLRGNLVAATEALIERHNPAWSLGGGMGLYPAWLRGLGEAGFEDIASFSYDVAVPYTPEAWRGRIRASAGVAASLPPESVARFDADLAALLDERFPGDGWTVPHRVFAVTARRR